MSHQGLFGSEANGNVNERLPVTVGRNARQRMSRAGLSRVRQFASRFSLREKSFWFTGPRNFWKCFVLERLALCSRLSELYGLRYTNLGEFFPCITCLCFLYNYYAIRPENKQRSISGGNMVLSNGVKCQTCTYSQFRLWFFRCWLSQCKAFNEVKLLLEVSVICIFSVSVWWYDGVSLL